MWQLYQCLAFSECQRQQSQNPDRRPLRKTASTASSTNRFLEKLTEISEDDWTALLTAENLAPIAFRLSEIRRDGKELLSEAEETIINTLNLDGLNAWSQHYDTIVASIEIPFLQEDGTTINLSAGQAFNKMMGDPDPEVRARLFDTWEKTWAEKKTSLQIP